MTQKLHFTSLNYIPKYTLHYKLFECTFYNINYNSCYTLHVNIKFFVNLDEKNMSLHEKNLIVHLFNPLKTNEKLHFIILNYIS